MLSHLLLVAPHLVLLAIHVNAAPLPGQRFSLLRQPSKSGSESHGSSGSRPPESLISTATSSNVRVPPPAQQAHASNSSSSSSSSSGNGAQRSMEHATGKNHEPQAPGSPKSPPEDKKISKDKDKGKAVTEELQQASPQRTSHTSQHSTRPRHNPPGSSGNPAEHLAASSRPSRLIRSRVDTFGEDAIPMEEKRRRQYVLYVERYLERKDALKRGTHSPGSTSGVKTKPMLNLNDKRKRNRYTLYEEKHNQKVQRVNDAMARLLPQQARGHPPGPQPQPPGPQPQPLQVNRQRNQQHNQQHNQQRNQQRNQQHNQQRNQQHNQQHNIQGAFEGESDQDLGEVEEVKPPSRPPSSR